MKLVTVIMMNDMPLAVASNTGAAESFRKRHNCPELGVIIHCRVTRLDDFTIADDIVENTLVIRRQNGGRK